MNIRPNIVLAVVTVVIVALALVAAIVSLRQPTSAGDPSTPQGVVRAYAKAVVEQNYSAAAALVDSELNCTPAHFAASFVPEDVALTLLEASDRADPANVTVAINSYGESFIGSSSQEVFELHRFEDTWRITSTPWPVYNCGVLP